MYTLFFFTASLLAADPLPDGSLLFLENCNKFVEVYTREEVGHVAMVFRDGKTTWVYEATPDHVRRLTLDSYYDELARDNLRRKKQVRIVAHRPKEPFSAAEVETMRGFLDKQLGRRYSVLNYARRRVGDGTHCAELTGNTLNHTERFDLSDPNRITPGELQRKIAANYQPAEQIALPAYEAEETWCQRTYRRWQACTMWCRWTCGEAWAYCF